MGNASSSNKSASPVVQAPVKEEDVELKINEPVVIEEVQKKVEEPVVVESVADKVVLTHEEPNSEEFIVEEAYTAAEELSVVEIT